MEINKLSKRTRLLLSIVHLSGGTLSGATRIQKLALLISKDLEKSGSNLSIFNDWVAGDYGGRSAQVYQSIGELSRNQMLKERETTFHGNKMTIYDLTSHGKDTAADLERLFGESWVQITTTVQKYVSAKTEDLVALSYDLYPELTIHSKIKPEVNRRLLKNASPLSEMYEEDIGELSSPRSVDKRRKELRQFAEDEQFFKQREFEMQKLPDIEARKRLAAVVGLKELPKLDPMAIYRLDGIIGRQLRKHKRFDSVELVRSVRGD